MKIFIESGASIRGGLTKDTVELTEANGFNLVLYVYFFGLNLYEHVVVREPILNNVPGPIARDSEIPLGPRTLWKCATGDWRIGRA